MAELRNKNRRPSKTYEGISIKKDETDDITPAASPSPSLDASVKSETVSRTPVDSEEEEEEDVKVGFRL